MVKKLLAIAFLMGATVTAWAAIPAPPVNQNLGIPDQVFFLEGQTGDATVCAGCHRGTPPTGIPIKPGYLPDRHHQHLGTPIGDGPADPPFPDGNRDGVVNAADANYVCLNCHNIVNNQIDNTHKDCMNCHAITVAGSPTTVHHRTDKAQEGSCFACHGDLVRGIDPATLKGKRPNPDGLDLNGDGVPDEYLPSVIPTYGVSMISPWPSDKPNSCVGTLDPATGDCSQPGKGNCNFCHNTANYQPVDPIAVGVIAQNKQTHHGTGLGQDFSLTADCTWCHDFTGMSAWPDAVTGEISGNQLRSCERCHDVSSIHSIEFDAVGDGIVPGAEAPGNGHIGNNINCEGCHGFVMPALSDSGTVTIPVLTASSLSTSGVGSSQVVTLEGNSLVNSTQDSNGNPITHSATVLVTDSEGNSISITPNFVTPSTIEFALPGTLPAGSGIVQARKGEHLSNPMPFVVTNETGVDAAYFYSKYNLLILLTQNESEYLAATNSGTSVVCDGVTASVVYRWGRGMVAVQGNCGGTVELNGVFGSKSINPSVF